MGNVGHVLIAKEPPATCGRCDREGELRPYGPNGQPVCVRCALKMVAVVEHNMGVILLGHEGPLMGEPV